MRINLSLDKLWLSSSNRSVFSFHYKKITYTYINNWIQNVPSREWDISCWWSLGRVAWTRRDLRHWCWRPPCSPTQTRPTSVGTPCHRRRRARCSPWCQCGCHSAPHSYGRFRLHLCHTLRQKNTKIIMTIEMSFLWWKFAL